MFEIGYHNKVKKDIKKCNKRGFDLKEFLKVIDFLEKTGEVPSYYKPHVLSGNYAGVWECHIKPDWLLLWIKFGNEITIIRTGTHSDLF